MTTTEIILLIAALPVLAVIVILIASRAPDGHEDATGFHHGEPGEDV